MTSVFQVKFLCVLGIASSNPNATLLFCFEPDFCASVICPIIVPKLAVTLFTSLYFRSLCPNCLNFFWSLYKINRSMTEKKTIFEHNNSGHRVNVVSYVKKREKTLNFLNESKKTYRISMYCNPDKCFVSKCEEA